MNPIVTIERFILDNQPEYAVGDFTSLLYDIALAAKVVSAKTLRAGLVDILGQAGSMNVQGESQQKLDIYADQVIKKLNDHTGRLCVMASEEHEEIIHIPRDYKKGRYVLVYDPLDGSSNIDVNVSTGTIFGIFKCLNKKKRGRLEDCLQPARDLVGAGYILYGTSTMLVYSTGNGVHGFTLDPDLGEFLLSHQDIKIPDPPLYYSTNFANFNSWDAGMRDYYRWLREGEDRPAGMSGRYIGSLVADFHRNLIKGGVYMYPSQDDSPEGKLRLLYEAGPLSYIAEQAGGRGSNGHQSILDIKPKNLHQRTPLFIGNRSLVTKAESIFGNSDSTPAIDDPIGA